MENQQDIDNAAIQFDFLPAQENHSIIKVVGVGGGGSNAVQHMYDAGIEDVSFLIINTDKQALKGSSIPNKLLISEKGLGAGAQPDVARDFAQRSADAIRQALSDGTEMVFITAGMGGGTGTGAAPVVAQIAHELGILTIGIVTIPFKFEGTKKIMMALEGVRAIKKWCDALLVVNNNRLIDVYPDLNFGNAFAKADDTLTTAAKSISDIINIKGYINLDFADVSTTLRNGGVALISTGNASGENRLTRAIEAATTSPLLQDNNINDAQHLLFELCFSHSNPLTMSEIAEMNEFVGQLNSEIEVIWGAMYDDSLGDDVRIILLASGFAMDIETGKILAEDKIGDRLKKMQTQLRESITDFQTQLAEFDDYPEASEILNNAIRQAIATANALTPDDSIDDEKAKLDTALMKARDKKQEIIDRAAQEEANRQEEARQADIRRRIEELQRMLNTPAPAAPAVATTPEPPAPTAPEPVASAPTAPEVPASEPVGTPQPVEPEPVHVGTPAPKTVEPTVAKPRPADGIHSGIEEIRRFYGEETANKMLLDDTRKAYYVLDDKELTNEQLIDRLERLPAYNRTLEDLGQLRVVSRTPAQPRAIGRHNNPSDGSIPFE